LLQEKCTVASFNLAHPVYCEVVVYYRQCS